MGLTELQLPAKIDFYNNLKTTATEMYNVIAKWKAVADFIGDIETADLDDIGVAAGQVRTDLTDFRTVLNEMIAFFAGESTSQTKIPANIIQKIRRMR